MLFRADGKPRFWIDGFDPWHLLLGLVLAGLLAWMVLMPSVPVKPLAAARPKPVAPVFSPPPASSTPTLIQSPYSGQVMTPRRMSDCEGTAEPGSVVRLLWNGKVLGETRADSEGRWRFALANFARGQHRILVEAGIRGHVTPSSEVLFTVDEPKPTKPQQAKAPPPRKNLRKRGSGNP